MHLVFHALDRKQCTQFVTVCCRVVVVSDWQGRVVTTTQEPFTQNHMWEIGGAAALGFCISCISVPTDVEVSLPSVFVQRNLNCANHTHFMESLRNVDFRQLVR